MNNELTSRWNSDLFLMVKDFICRENFFEGASHEFLVSWYQNYAPKAIHPVDQMGLDLDARYLNLSGLTLGKSVALQCIIDYGVFENSHFLGTFMQNASAFYANFKNCYFERTQMSPLFAHGANFENSEFNMCFAFGLNPHSKIYGEFNDFSAATFRKVVAKRTGFSRSSFEAADLSFSIMQDCEFNSSIFLGCNLSHAMFEKCSFSGDIRLGRSSQCDFRGSNLDGVQFIACDFLNAIFDDTPSARKAIESGTNLNCETINWCLLT
jgi:uncharacterized protein YjbI with pentapeptide repeats